MEIEVLLWLGCAYLLVSEDSETRDELLQIDHLHVIYLLQTLHLLEHLADHFLMLLQGVLLVLGIASYLRSEDLLGLKEFEEVGEPDHSYHGLVLPRAAFEMNLIDPEHLPQIDLVRDQHHRHDLKLHVLEVDLSLNLLVHDGPTNRTRE